MFLAAVAAAVAQVLVVAQPAHAYEVRITIMGAGQIVETTSANLVGSGCVTSANNPTGTLGKTCLAGTPSGDYGWGWTVRLVATPKPGYRFVRWQSDGSARSPVLCDGADGSSTYTDSACQFATLMDLQLQAVFVDDTAPTMASLTGPNQAVNGSTAFTFAAAADPTIQGFECRVANVHDWVPCASGRQENPALSGLYTFEVRAVDSSGNRSPISSWNWTVDKLAPVTTVTSAPSGTVASTSATFEFTSNESGTFTCTLDAVSTPCTSPTTYTGLSQGTHTFQVMATDGAGNNSAGITRTWTVDTVAPTASSARPTGSRVSLDSNASVVFSEAMKKSTVESAANGVPKNLYLTLSGTKVPGVVTYTQSLSGGFKAVLNPARRLRPGRTYKLVVTAGALDRAGNALAPRSWTFQTRG